MSDDKEEETIPPISTKRITTSHLNSLNIQKITWKMQVLAWDRQTNVAGFNLLIGSDPLFS